MEDGTRLRAALFYVTRLGWAVFPLHTPAGEGKCSCRRDCGRDAGKHPRTLHGLQDATKDEAKVEEWWGMWPDANIGIACGASGIAVLDVDPRHGGDESLHDLIDAHGDNWLETAIQLTGGGGAHYVFADPDGTVRDRVNFMPGLDARGRGGYIVAAPSIHLGGREYAWEQHPRDYPLAGWPAFLDDIGRRRTANEDTEGPIESGRRNAVLTSMAGSMRRRGFSEEAIYLALRDTNQKRCAPPLADRDLRKISGSVASYSPAKVIVPKTQADSETAVLSYGPLRKLLTIPPMYELGIGPRIVRISAKELQRHAALRSAVLEQLDILLPTLKPQEWDDQLTVLLDEIQHEATPADASEEGIVMELVRNMGRTATDDRALFENGRPVLGDDGELWVTGKMVRDWLKTHGIAMEQRRIFAILREHGATATTVRVTPERVMRAWVVPMKDER